MHAQTHNHESALHMHNVQYVPEFFLPFTVILDHYDLFLRTHLGQNPNLELRVGGGGHK